MKKLAVIIILCSCLGFCFKTSGQVFQNSELTITRLENNMWVFETSDKTTMYLVEGTNKAMLIDTGTRINKLDSIVGLITKKPLIVVITHAHSDHAGNIRFFKEIWMHPADTVLLNRSYNGKINFVKDGDIFDLGGTKIEVSHMPAHTPGSIVLLDRKAGICYSGDAFGSNHVWLQLKPLSPMQTYVNSCLKMEKLMDSGITKIYCGHYPYVKKPFDKSYITTMRHLAEGLINGTGPEAQPYAQKVGCPNPMSVTSGEATIVFDPDYLKQQKK
jgi:glyoxylase-like metal-dependent hydrolase (beta-lactamase superfamily II)